ncbi:MAG: sugar-binding domain-containing protein [Proteiniphilum sp.]|jgi:beta-galactosidase/beta-glucuronidase|nr:glycoside hydrolase family 2 TIM barrel-domain containing protein [Proteiniphilum sp.]MDD2936691.1 glycoside hydrolase family 2 TIM barrel-domain containing protein [Proteiniphilum sp.]MDD3075593.1 glycoside hydrolase family 2 TIM barrel-domain containing protein [Proteiniphilum sp.]MDD4451728.1 glycoside hydrolase family 2 TIM barrel-domain containing protein [Proteiniphilum sp.]NCB25072.1 beta-galactosidase [Bacteroidia bacterium]
MRTIVALFFTLLLTFNLSAQWQPAGDKIKTRWATEIDVNNVLPEYPRPIMERAEWQNLNGLWNYAILPVGKQKPAGFEGEILVPFAIESSLSGVQKRVGRDNELWYQREFTVPAKWKNNKVLLHFGAVDWKADVWVNDVKVGQHTGGYTPFSFDITPALASGKNTLVVKVWDSTDQGYQPRGKQVNKPEGIWYTPVTGIWQTVWLEPVPETYIEDLKITPNIDNNTLKVQALTNVASATQKVEVIIKEGDKIVATSQAINNQPVEIIMPENVKLWSPDSPYLYDVEVVLWNGSKQLDKVDSYAAMRKYSTHRDDKGIVRLQLNNKDLFQFGPLDQGWWPDGLYTAPTDEALEYDIIKTKDFGFNMIRKHVKVEPARWYTHCDRHGIIVWQDMPSGDRGPGWNSRDYFKGPESMRTAESEANYRKEWKEIMDYLYSYPSIGVWVPFNEAWGQFKTVEIVEWTKQHDPSRLVNPASGGNHYPVGDMLDLHQYPAPQLYLYDAQRPTVLGEYGGIGWANKEHLWEPNRNWGYVQFNSSKEVTDEYVKYAEELKQLIRQGFSAAVYTQTTDVEVEVNGLMTYDRKLVKIDEERVKKVNQEICNILND